MATSIGAMFRREIPPASVATHAQSIQHGLDEIWVVEDLPRTGGISRAMIVLEATNHVAIGHGTALAPFRNPAALAIEWATLAQIHPGRVLAGIGHCLPPWMADVGEKVTSPPDLLRESITSIQRLLAGERVTVDGRYVHLDDVALEHPPAEAPPISAGVAEPESLQISGAVADGTILPVGHGPAEIEQARGFIEIGRREAGRTSPHRLTVFAGFYLGDPDELETPISDTSTGWNAVGSRPSQVTKKLQTLIDAGADCVILVPFGKDFARQLRLASSAIAPQLVRS